FEPFRKNIIGYVQTFKTPHGERRIVYADWTASGRLYRPIEEKMLYRFGPFVGNTHTETTITGTYMTAAYHEAHEIIKRHVNDGPKDVIITQGSGMTGVINKFQRLLGLRVPEQAVRHLHYPENERPVIFVTHMEHHSNHTSWLETIGEVVCIPPDERGAVDLNFFADAIKRYSNRQKIASVTACSNVTGIRTPYHAIAKMMHEAGGLCFVDFACSAPYVPIDMHPSDPLEKLDAIYFSPHKFLGGPGTPGVLIFDSDLYVNKIPDQPGGGTVNWTNPWGEVSFLDNIEAREDGGTPPFLQTIKAALCIRLKEKMNSEMMLKREEEFLPKIFHELRSIPGLHILADEQENRLAVISFYIDGLHYNLGVKLLNDYFGIQVRGGCSCAGTYGHYLLHISRDVSHKITDKIDHGDLSEKPGWIRMSLHPAMTNEEIHYILNAIREVAAHFKTWQNDYGYDVHTNEFIHRADHGEKLKLIHRWMQEV
ncbi:aminotransferase class V-fold PLP-dependent enzyme, partial [bacterium]|nr:aminotransferase class V-fold PLP-dependent enzyme [bacterium]